MEKLNREKNEGKKKKSEFFLRTFSGFFITVIILGGIYFGGYYWNILASLIAIVSLYEFYNIVSTRYSISPVLLMTASVFMLLSSIIDGTQTSTLCSITILIFAAMYVEIVKKQNGYNSNAIRNMGLTVAGVIYIILPWSFMIVTRTRPSGDMFLYTLFFCTWACDVFAYLVGSMIGSHKLCVNVSPKKTWEGFIGGWAASTAVAALVGYAFNYSILPLVLLGALLGVAGQIGDLAESLLKREAGVKDSGSIIPGHGGFLDRFDSILINATFVFLMIELV